MNTTTTTTMVTPAPCVRQEPNWPTGPTRAPHYSLQRHASSEVNNNNNNMHYPGPVRQAKAEPANGPHSRAPLAAKKPQHTQPGSANEQSRGTTTPTGRTASRMTGARMRPRTNTHSTCKCITKREVTRKVHAQNRSHVASRCDVRLLRCSAPRCFSAPGGVLRGGQGWLG